VVEDEYELVEADVEPVVVATLAAAETPTAPPAATSA
jgi:hypothetical protein